MKVVKHPIKRHQNKQLKTHFCHLLLVCLINITKMYWIFYLSNKFDGEKMSVSVLFFALSNRLENTNIWDILIWNLLSFYARCFFLTRGFYRMFHNSRFVFWGSNCSEGWKLMLFSMKSSIPFHCWNISYQPPRSLLSNSKW